MKKTFLLVTCLILTLFSCNDVSDFLFETEQTVELRTIENGSIFQGGDTFSLLIYSDRTVVPEEYKVTIFDDTGVNWGETLVAIDRPDDEYSSNLVVPSELPPGKYIFRIQVFENDVVIEEEEIILFKADGKYSIDQLISIPHETESGKDVFIRADISYPERVDPYLRWSLDDVVLHEGHLSKGLDTLHWVSEIEPGLYRISLEIFPEPVDSDMVSSVQDAVEIVVSEDPIEETHALNPEDRYSLLYHFAGDLLPVNSDEFATSLFGSAGALPYGNTFLYTLQGNSGLMAEGSVIPQVLSFMTPFSINGRLAALNPVEPGNILRVEDRNREIISLSLTDTGHLEFNFFGESSISGFSVLEMTDFTIHIIPRSESLEVRWFSDGLAGGSDSLFYRPEPLSLNQRVYIGGSGNRQSAGLILDELGFYVRSMEESAVDDNQFRRVKEYLLGSDLVDARGFDGLTPGLAVKAGEKALIGSFTGSVRDLEAVLAFDGSNAGERWDLLLEDEEGSELFRLNQASLDSMKVRISLLDKSGMRELVVNGDKNRTEFLKTYLPGSKFSLFLETHVENSNDVTLDYYIIYNITESLLPEAVATAEEVENLM